MADDPGVQAMGPVFSLVLTDTCLMGDLIGWDGTNWVKADATVTAPLKAEWVALKAARVSGDVIEVSKVALIFDADAPYTKGALQFLSGTAGKITETNPAAVASITQVVGRAITTSLIFVDTQIPHYEVSTSLVGTAPATTTNYDNFYVPNLPVRLVGVREAHRTAGTDGGAVSIDLEKLTSGTAAGSGTGMLSAVLSLKTTAATPQFGSPSTTAATARLKPGDRVSLLLAGTPTAVAGVAVTAIFVPDL